MRALPSLLVVVAMALFPSTVSASPHEHGHDHRPPGPAPDVPRPQTDLQERVDGTPAGGELRIRGDHRGPVLLDKPLSLVGEPGAVVEGGNTGTVITVTAPDVEIRSLVVRNSGDSLDREDAGIAVNAPRARILSNHLDGVLFGVYLRGATDSVVSDNVIVSKELPVPRRGDAIRLWESDQSTVEGNRIARGRDTVLWFSDDVTVRGNTVRDGRYGLHFMYSNAVHIEDNHLEGNSVGAYLMYSRGLELTGNTFLENRGPSGYGIGLKDMDGVRAERNRFVGNRVGIYLDNSPSSMDVEQHFRRNLFAYNDVGVQFLPSVRRNVLWENAFVENREQVGIQGGGRLRGNSWTTHGAGNHWSDFAGFDADGDGVGDVPYRLEDLYSSLTDRHPALTFFADTPASRAIDFAAEALPLLRPEPKVVDEAPLIVPPQVPSADIGASPSRGPVALVSAALLLIPFAVLAWAGAIRVPEIRPRPREAPA